jgi:hypothetical protein
MLTFDAGDFQLQIEPVSSRFEEPQGAYFEWVNARITIVEPGIRAEGLWSVMPEELRQFQQQLQSMRARLQPGQTAELSGVERNFKLILQMLERGQVIGNWFFQPVPTEGAHITGVCGFDQSGLRMLLQGVESLLSLPGDE